MLRETIYREENVFMKSKVLRRRVLLVSLVMTLMLSTVLVLGGCGCSGSDKKESLSWPTSNLASLLPKPSQSKGKVSMDSESYLNVEVYDVNKDDYKKYVENCKEKGFTVDYNSTDSSYSAKDQGGNTLMLYYSEKKEEMSISLTSASQVEKTKADNEKYKAEQEAKKQAEEAAKAGQANAQQSGNAQSDASNAMQQANEAMQNYNDTVRQSKELVDSYSNLLDQASKFQ